MRVGREASGAIHDPHPARMGWAMDLSPLSRSHLRSLVGSVCLPLRPSDRDLRLMATIDIFHCDVYKRDADGRNPSRRPAPLSRGHGPSAHSPRVLSSPVTRHRPQSMPEISKMRGDCTTTAPEWRPPGLSVAPPSPLPHRRRQPVPSPTRRLLQRCSILSAPPVGSHHCFLETT